MKADITIGDKYRPAMFVTDPVEAHRYFEECVQHNMENSPNTRVEAERIEKTNLGYFAGYFDTKTRERVERLFCCVHPVFGTVKNPVNPKEAFAMGVAMGSGTTFVKDERPCPKGKRE